MEFIRYETLRDFLDDTLPLLLQNEAQNSLMIADAREGAKKDLGWFGCTVTDGGELMLAAVAAPPFPLMLSEPGNRKCPPARALLVRELRALGTPVEAVLAERELAGDAAERFAALSGKHACLFLGMNLYVCTNPLFLPLPPGGLRLLRESDFSFAPRWQAAFRTECGFEMPSPEECGQTVWRHMAAGSQWLWEDGVPVSQAVVSGRTPNGMHFSGVYTPPERRGKGYAKACVGCLTQRFLTGGTPFCSLFADRKNPVSNAVYRSIGYEKRAEVDEIHLE